MPNMSVDKAQENRTCNNHRGAAVKEQDLNVEGRWFKSSEAIAPIFSPCSLLMPYSYLIFQYGRHNKTKIGMNHTGTVDNAKAF